MNKLSLLIVVALAAACADTGQTDGEVSADGSGQEQTAAADTGMIFNTPEGGVLDWVADIQAGLDSVPRLAAENPSAAEGAVRTLYVLRQEYLEGYYGEGGRLAVSEELAEAIDRNEERFHDVMNALSGESPDLERIEALTDSLSMQTDRIREVAESIGEPLTPWDEAP